MLASGALLVVRAWEEMSSGSSDVRDSEGGRLGGARADFVGSLGRKVNDTLDVLVALEDDPSSRPARDELRRRLHALAAGARLLRFDAMARSLQEALAVLDRGTMTGALTEQEVAFVAQVVRDLPAMAWGESPPSDVPASPAPDELPRALPVAVLVVGDEGLAEALGDEGGPSARTFERERIEDAQSALDLARAYAPDLIVVDADVPQCAQLVEALLDDPLTEPVPIVVVGSFRTSEEAARFVALGVARAMTKPVVPSVLRGVCDDVIEAREARPARTALGEPTLEQLAVRLAEEVRRALVDSVDGPARACRVPLGEGTEVLGAVWGAIARVQAVVTQKTGGAVRFAGSTPDGAIALAPWLHQDVPASERLAGRGRGATGDVRLPGRRVVVADDDPGVTWFISDLLRTAGCEVFEALDGNTALEHAFRVHPDLVVSDILMPGRDGFALCRALRRDVAMRDVPVILLSWKEDLLQRVRELGASASAYMRKESDSRSILARVREVLQPRARIEMRIRGDGEVRGRLDGLTPRLLLELVGAVRKDARVSVRDATCLYEIEIRGGVPRKATSTASDGSYVSGERAVARLLSLGDGRFVVSPSVEPIRGELAGTLSDMLAGPIAAARGAIAAVTGARTMSVERITLDDDSLEEYLSATPDPAWTVVKRLSRAASPRQMLLAGEVSPSLLEDVLVDLASRGAIRAVQGPNRADLLTPEVDSALALLGGAPRRSRSLPPNARPSVLPAPVAIRPVPRAPSTAPSPGVAKAPRESHRPTTPSPPPQALDAWGDGPPSSLEDAVMREISDRSPDAGAARVTTPKPPPIVEPSQLRKRPSSNPPTQHEPPQHADEPTALPSMPPDAMVPDAGGPDEGPAANLGAPHDPPSTALAEPTDEPSPLPELPPPLEPAVPAASGASQPPVPDEGVQPADGRLVPPESPRPPSVAPPAAELAEAIPAPLLEPEPAEERYTSPFALTTEAREPARLAPRAIATEEWGEVASPAPWKPSQESPAEGPPSVERTLRLVPMPPSPSPSKRPAAVRPKPEPWLFLIAFVLLGLTVGVVLYVNRADDAELARAIPPVPTLVASGASAPATSPPSIRLDDPADPPPVPPGLGLVVVTAPPGVRVRIDGAVAGMGPRVDAIAAPGYHEVRVEQQEAGDDKQVVVEVRAGKTTRIGSAQLP